MPGYLGKVDLSLYFYDIIDEKSKIPEKFKAPHWEAVTRTDFQKSININNVSNEEICKKEEDGKIEENKNECVENSPEKEKKEKEKLQELADNITKDIFDYFSRNIFLD